VGDYPPTSTPGTTGRYHVAILYPTRKELADALLRVRAAWLESDGAADHDVTGERSLLKAIDAVLNPAPPAK
jgi:catechol 2,3-dioxygenase